MSMAEFIGWGLFVIFWILVFIGYAVEAQERRWKEKQARIKRRTDELIREATKNR